MSFCFKDVKKNYTFTEPLLSVIIPVYNSEKTIIKCLNSVVTQTLEEIEIIIINDGSTDETLSLIMDCAKSDSRIKVINNKNQGQGLSRNEGLRLAQGEYVTFIDSDDWIEPEMFEIMLDCAQKTGVDVVQCEFLQVYENNKKPQKSCIVENLKSNKVKVSESNIYKLVDYKESVIMALSNFAWGRIYKKDFIIKNKIEFSSGFIGEDKAFSIECKILANGIACINKPLYNYYIRSNSSSSKSIDAIAIMDSIRYVLDKHQLFNELKESFYKYANYLCYKQYKKSSWDEKRILKSKFKDYLEEKYYRAFCKKVFWKDLIKKVLKK